MKSFVYCLISATLLSFSSCSNSTEEAQTSALTEKEISQEQHAANMKATQIAAGIANPDFDSKPYFIYPGDLVTFCPNEAETKQLLNDSSNQSFSDILVDFKYYNSVLRDTLKVLKTAQFKNSSSQSFAIIQGVDTVYVNKSEFSEHIGYIYNPIEGAYFLHEGIFNEVDVLANMKKALL